MYLPPLVWRVLLLLCYDSSSTQPFPRLRLVFLERKKNRSAKRGMGRGQGPHLHESTLLATAFLLSAFARSSVCSECVPLLASRPAE